MYVFKTCQSAINNYELISVHEIYMLCSSTLLQVNKALDNKVYLVIIKG